MNAYDHVRVKAGKASDMQSLYFLIYVIICKGKIS